MALAEAERQADEDELEDAQPDDGAVEIPSEEELGKQLLETSLKALRANTGGVPVTNTTGTDNVPGATRSGTLAGGAYYETLTAYKLRSDVLEYSYHGDPYILAVPGQPTINFNGYAETMRFESICGGKATYIDIITYTCSDHQTLAYSGWYTFHESVFPGLAATLRATIMAGDCPRQGNRVQQPFAQLFSLAGGPVALPMRALVGPYSLLLLN
ncbi:hypothetical protein B0H14DRAFT_3879526 [Mycena olivaceomarginata]|nr:hypothetical protein B0H14DRAFT_3879526 [Mycena olivaceomarginata]